MASSHVESDDSEECETDSDSEDDIEAVSESLKPDNLKKELEGEDSVLKILNEIEEIEENEALELMLILIERVTAKLLKGSFQDITSMFSNGAIFFVDGDSLLLHLMGDVNYDVKNGGQLLHLIYLCERYLQLFSRKGGNFEIIFFNIWSQAWSGKHTLLLARTALITHLRFNMLFRVHEFDSIWDINFRNILEKRNCAFLLTDSEMMDTYTGLFPDEDHVVQELLFHVSICYSLVGLYLPCVDTNDVRLTVSTLNAFFFPPGAKLGHGKLRKLLHSIIQTIEEKCKPPLVSLETVASPLIPVEGESDVRHVVTVTAAAEFLKDSSAPQPREDWMRAFLLYSSLLEVLPLKFRGCPSVVAHTSTFTVFLEHIHRHMNCVLQEVLRVGQTANYNFNTVSDLWHGNLFSFVVNYVIEHGACEEILLGTQTLAAYEKLLQDVVRLTEKPLLKFPVTIQGMEFSEKTNEEEENSSTLKIATSLPACYDLKHIVTTNCFLTFEFCKDLVPDIKKNDDDNDTCVNITRNSNFEEKYHWHSKRLISDQYDHVRDDNLQRPMDRYQLKKHHRTKGRYAYFMSIYGSSIEGRYHSTKTIVCESGNAYKKKSSKSKKLGKNAQKIIEDNCRKKQAKTEESDRKLLDFFKEKYKRYKERDDYSAALNEVQLLERRLKTKEVLRNTLIYKVRILWCMWKNQRRRVSVISDSLQYAKELFLVIREILKDFDGIALNDKDSELLGHCLWQMGLERIAQCWNLPGPPKGTSDKSYSIEMSWIDFQLLHLGPDLERESESMPDNRVEGFKPDKWQRELFDSVDRHQSVLVVAPTSSGKTYASYYCMEKVLRESNDGVVVYVAPTKALVNQVAATIYARFKNKDMPPGKSVYGVFTREYRVNGLNSQILVTVPECLALLLLSPCRRNWVRSLRYVIFDEIHCLAGQMGGFSWECGLLLIQCPFLALSATVEDPESLHTWLQNMQEFKRKQDITNGCENNHNFYKVNLVVYRDRHSDLRKHVFCEDGQFHHIHPCAYLDRAVINEERGIPKSITLSPEEVRDLYIAMNVACPQDSRLKLLHPEIFFSVCMDGFISRNMVRNFEVELKRLLENWATEEGPAFESVVMALRTVTEPLGNLSERSFIGINFIKFIQELQERKMLPAIVFSYNRSLISDLFNFATEYYEDIAQKCEDGKKSEGRKRPEDDDGMQEWDEDGKRAGKVNEDSRVSTRFTTRNKYEPSLNLLRSSCAHPDLIRGVGHIDEKIIEFVERRLRIVGHKQGGIFPRGLSMGVGLHHGGLNSKERSAVEMFFRMKLLNLVFATGTLALGIHMPCKTVAVVGDSPFLNPLEFQQMSGRAGRRGFDNAGSVVFMGLNERKMRRLLLGKLPRMVGNFPLNVTMVLRLLLMVNDVTCDGPHSEEMTNVSLSRALTLLNCCLVYETIPELKVQMKHFFAFSTQLLMLQGLLDDEGNPQFCTGIVTHLHYHEPGNLAFVYLMRNGALRELCMPEEDGTISKETQMNVVIVLSYLFAPLIYRKPAKGVRYYNSKVVLPPLPPEIKEALEMYNEEVMYIYDNYFRFVAKDCAKRMGDDDTLPVSGVRIETKESFKPYTEGPMNLERWIVENCEPRTICSAFAALSGHTDEGLYSHHNMISNIRHQVFTDVKVVPIVELHRTYNGYAWDFYNHGILTAIQDDNGLKQGEDYNLLCDFSLVLKVLKTTLSELKPIDENDQIIRTLNIVEKNYSYNFSKAYGIISKD